MTDLTDRVSLVTGSTKGIGKAIAMALVERGSRVVVHGRDQAATRAVCARVGAYAAVDGDLATVEGTARILDQLAAIDDVDVLVNNAGIFSVADFFAVDDDEWLRYHQTNVLSVVRLCRALLPGMLERNWGRVINLASEAGIKPLPQMIHYSVSKTSLIGLSRGLAELTKGTSVSVNSILPGPTWTEGVEKYFDGLAAEEGRPVEEVLKSYFREHEPNSLIQRFVTVDEVANAAAFVAGNGAVNGSALRVEGGIIRAI